MMIGLGTVLMFDGENYLLHQMLLIFTANLFSMIERTAQNNLHTMLLTTFRQVGGLEALLDICRRCTAAIDQILNSPSRNKDEENELVYAFSGLKVALGLLHPLVASKTLFDSVQTSMLITRDKPKDSPDYFEPHDFLVKLRASILPFIAEVWNTSWLPSAPLSVTKSVIQAMLEIMGADKEDYKADAADPTAGTWAIGGAAPRRAAPPAPDENRIRQLCDMGFPRASAERALARTHNNVSAATEYLLSHPFSFVGGMVPEPDDGHDDGDDDGDGDDGDGDGGDDGEPEPEAEPEEAEQVPVEASNDQDPSTAEAAPGPAAEPDAEMIDVETTDNSPGKGKAKEATEPDWKKRLDEMREPLKSEVGSRALQLVDHHPSLVFDIKAVFIGPPDGYQSVSVSVLYKDIKSFSSSSSPAGEKEQALAIRCHLLALLLNEATNPPTRISSIDAEDLMGSLLALLRTVSFPEGSPPNIPKWLASHLLVAESIFVLGEEPTAIALPAENELIKEEEELMSGPLYKEARAEVFTFCLRLLAVDQLPRNELMALLRLLVLLTRDHGYATDFVSRGGVTLLLDRFKRPSKDSRGCQMHIAMILRHVVEDRTVLQSIMKQELKKWFSQPRTRSRAADVATLLRNCSQMLLRDPSSFIATAQSICRLVQPHPASGVYHVNLKDDVLSEDKALTPADPSASQAGIPEVVTTPETAAVESTLRKDTPSSEALDSVLRHLISELMRVGKLAVASCAASTPTPKQDGLSPPSRAVPLSSPAAAATGQASPSHASPPEAHEDYLYACFLMQCLTELLSAYTPCKLAFFSYQSKKRVGTPSKDSSKHRSSVLNFLLTDMISVGDAVNASTSTTEVQRRMLLGNWAMSVIVALCVNSSDAPPSGEQKDVLADLASVRKLVLDTIGKAIKEASSVESVETRYAKLYGLAELCYRLLIFKPDANTPAGSRDDQTLQLAKVMVEKNFVGILTNALAEVDLNYPNVKILVTGMLRPIELL
jgi:E3 ubiquitin-protein ligase HUWE1